MEQFRNPGTHTYNGVKALAWLSGLPEAEIAWTAQRMQGLMREGKSKQEAIATVKAEAVSKPWEKAT